MRQQQQSVVKLFLFPLLLKLFRETQRGNFFFKKKGGRGRRGGEKSWDAYLARETRAATAVAATAATAAIVGGAVVHHDAAIATAAAAAATTATVAARILGRARALGHALLLDQIIQCLVLPDQAKKKKKKVSPRNQERQKIDPLRNVRGRRKRKEGKCS
jgi:hypothetical protein